jgi:ATP phosphoribosyltransferase regulatory subunit
MSAWVLPDHIADVLPNEARRIEELRRALLDKARHYGCELVAPPLLEHLESLLTGASEAMDLQTFKLIDQLSGRTLGLRPDTTSQVARIDAHLLNRKGVTRLCYCGPVLHVRPHRPHASREPLQLGVEIFGHQGREADLEVLNLAIDCLTEAGVENFSVDLSDGRIFDGLLAGLQVPPKQVAAIRTAMGQKDPGAVQQAVAHLPEHVAKSMNQLVRLCGSAAVLDDARTQLPQSPGVTQALDDLQWLDAHLRRGRKLQTTFDLAEQSGYGYYTGSRFSVYVPGLGDALIRGGRYDHVGQVFGRERPAVGFSLDLKELVAVSLPTPLGAAVRAPWSEDLELAHAIARLRALGEVVVCVLPGHDNEVDEFDCDRELVRVNGQWVVQSLLP